MGASKIETINSSEANCDLASCLKCDDVKVARGMGTILPIQYLRGLAALMVVFAHAEGMGGLPKYLNDRVFGGGLDWGAIGVDLFFTISGFIIPYVALTAHSLKPRLPLPNFLKKRFIRIVPFMWVCIIAHMMLRYVGRAEFDLNEFLNAMILWPIGELRPVQLWTLRHELIFYVWFAVAFIYFKSNFFKYIFWIGLLLPLISLVSGPLVDDTWFGFFAFRGHLFFACGMLLGILYLRTGGVKYLTLHPLAYVFMAIGFAILANYLNYERKDVISVIFVAVGCSIILATAIWTNESEHSPVISKCLSILGSASFSIYLVHDAVLSAFFGLVKASTMSHEVLVISAIASAVLFGVFVHFKVEVPLIKFVNKKID